MKTLLHCTGYASTLNEWEIRYGRWINSVETGPLDFDTILIPDDGSPELPSWDGVAVIDEDDLPDEESQSRGIIYRYQKHLGRQSIYVYPGWYRSFMFAAEYAKKYGYDKVIHIESDAFIISEKLGKFVNEFDQGWISLWCPRHQIPETSIQVIAGKDLEKFYELSKIPYSEVSGRPADPGANQGAPWLPYTVNRDFLGDRWGEGPHPTPRDADYTGQIPMDYDCWWI